MEEEIIKLSDLRKDDAVVPRQTLSNLVAPANQLDGIINNTSIEDRVLNTDGALLDGSLNQRIQRLNDKKNTFDLLNKRFENAENDLIREQQGRGITQLGRRNSLINNQRFLDAERKRTLSDIEDLRGNIETAERLRREARLATARTSKEKSRISGLSDRELLFEQAVEELVGSGSQASRLKDLGYFKLQKQIESFPGKLTPEIQQLTDFVDDGLAKIDRNRGRVEGPPERGEQGDFFINEEDFEEFGPDSIFGQNNFLDEFVDFTPSGGQTEGGGTLSVVEQARLAQSAKDNLDN